MIQKTNDYYYTVVKTKSNKLFIVVLQSDKVNFVDVLKNQRPNKRQFKQRSASNDLLVKAKETQHNALFRQFQS